MKTQKYLMKQCLNPVQIPNESLSFNYYQECTFRRRFTSIIKVGPLRNYEIELWNRNCEIEANLWNCVWDVSLFQSYFLLKKNKLFLEAFIFEESLSPTWNSNLHLRSRATHFANWATRCPQSYFLSNVFLFRIPLDVPPVTWGLSTLV